MQLPRRGLVAITLGLPLAAQAAEAGQVAALTGEANAEARRARRALAPPGPVFEGDLVSTSATARLTLRLGAALEVRLGGDVRLLIDRFVLRQGGTLELQKGPLLIDRGAGAPGLALRGPFGLIAVRGTRFFAGPSQGRFAVFVERGLVLLSSGDQSVEVAPRFGAEIPVPGHPPTDPTRWGEARIAAAMASVL